MRISLLVFLLICSMLMLTTQIQAERVSLDDDFVVDYSPDSLTLRPGEEGTVEFIFKNSGNETIFVALTQMVIKSATASGAFINPDFFELTAGESQVVVITVYSNAGYQGNDDSDCTIDIQWGHNLTIIEGRVDQSTVEGGTDITLQVTDDITLLVAILLVTVAIIALVIILYYWKRRSSSTSL